MSVRLLHSCRFAKYISSKQNTFLRFFTSARTAISYCKQQIQHSSFNYSLSNDAVGHSLRKRWVWSISWLKLLHPPISLTTVSAIMLRYNCTWSQSNREWQLKRLLSAYRTRVTGMCKEMLRTYKKDKIVITHLRWSRKSICG